MMLGGLATSMINANLFAYCGNNAVMRIDPTGQFFNSIGWNSRESVGFMLDLVLIIIMPWLFTAHKAMKLAKWAKGSRWFGKIYDKAVKSFAKGIFNVMDDILYEITGRATNAATRSFTLKRLEKMVGSIINLSLGYGIAWIIDCIDSDGESGYIRLW